MDSVQEQYKLPDLYNIKMLDFLCVALAQTLVFQKEKGCWMQKRENIHHANCSQVQAPNALKNTETGSDRLLLWSCVSGCMLVLTH